MNARLPAPSAPWFAELQLGFAARDGRSVLIHNRHQGPLRVQKALYPEGAAVCQAMVLHPPSGIAGGDELNMKINVGEAAHAQLTTPGAGKWYRSGGPSAAQNLQLQVANGGCLEWLPQESIVFDGAIARMGTRIELAADACFIGWDILCLGRVASGEAFRHGELSTQMRIERAGQALWLERGRVSGGDPMLASPAGWAGLPVCATLLCTFPGLDSEASSLLSKLRTINPTGEAGAHHGITALPGLLLARYLGSNSEAARQWLTELWKILRPACCGRPAVPPRIWQT